jgi:hypothetical protein
MQPSPSRVEPAGSSQEPSGGSSRQPTQEVHDMNSMENSPVTARVGWASAIALVAYGRRAALERKREQERAPCWWNRSGFTIPNCMLAAGLNRDYECCMGRLTERSRFNLDASN